MGVLPCPPLIEPRSTRGRETRHGTRLGGFAERLKATPTKPGVYRMRGASGEVLYVGKASSLRSRLRSYFSSPSGLAPKIRTMVGKVADFDFIVTESDQEALILEYNLIKQHKPTYNARLKDDKSYPFIKIDMSEEFPLVYITRTVTRDGSRYFGPFASAYSVRRTLSLLKKLFPYRSCTKTITGNDPRPCLDYYIHRCVAPCIGNVDTQQYQEVIDQVVLFLEGKADRVVKSIQARMERAAARLEFEQAAVLRDQLSAIESVHEGQKVLHLTSENLDVIAAASGRREAWVEVFFVRRGTLIGRDHFHHGGDAGRRAAARTDGFREAVLRRHPLRASPNPGAASPGGRRGAPGVAGGEAAGAGQVSRAPEGREAEAGGDGGRECGGGADTAGGQGRLGRRQSGHRP